MSERYKAAGPEPPLEELLADPITKLLLERDDIDPADRRSYLRTLRARLQPGPRRAGIRNRGHRLS